MVMKTKGKNATGTKRVAKKYNCSYSQQYEHLPIEHCLPYITPKSSKNSESKNLLLIREVRRSNALPFSIQETNL